MAKMLLSRGFVRSCATGTCFSWTTRGYPLPTSREQPVAFWVVRPLVATPLEALPPEP